MTTSGVRQGCVLAPALFCRAMDFIMDHVSPKVGQHSYTDIDYADDVTLFIDQQEKYPIALSAMLKTAPGHHPTGGMLEAELSPHGSIRSAGTREYR